MNHFCLFLIVVFGCRFSLFGQVITPEAKERAASLVSQMTLDEKLEYIGGYDGFYIRAVPRLGIPAIRMADGPQCVRNDTHSTLYPCGIALASTWDRNLARAYGRSLGRDCRARGVHIVLGPGVNIYRSPLCGRNFEYYGEDPYLASETAAEYIRGVQGEGVMATIKHFCGNNQEYDRHHVSSDIDERTLHEIYLPAFRKAVEDAEVGAVMSSYNLVNGQHMTENRNLSIGVLREQWGFEGIFMSDWDATYSVAGPVNNGLDLEMPGARYSNPANLKKLLATGVITEETIDEKCQHILQTLIAFNFLDREQKDPSIPERNPESNATALEVARNSMVLLKNDGLLPFGRRTRRVVVLGPNAVKLPMGGGSGEGSPFEYISVTEGLAAEKGLRVECLTPRGTTALAASGRFFTPDGEPGLRCEFYANRDLQGPSVVTTTHPEVDFFWEGAPAEGLPADHFSARWTGEFRPVRSERAIFTVSGDDGYRLFVDGREVLEHWSDHGVSTKTATLDVEAGRRYAIRLEFYDNIRTAEVKLQYAGPPSMQRRSPRRMPWSTARASTRLQRARIPTARSHCLRDRLTRSPLWHRSIRMWRSWSTRAAGWISRRSPTVCVPCCWRGIRVRKAAGPWRTSSRAARTRAVVCLSASSGVWRRIRLSEATTRMFSCFRTVRFGVSVTTRAFS